MRTFVIIMYILFSSHVVIAQPRSGRDISVKFSFRFFDKQGNVVTPQTKNSEIKIDFGLPTHAGTDSVNFFNGYFSCVSFAGAMVDICFILKKDTMKIRTSTFLDSVSFKKGNFLITHEYAPLFSIITHDEVNIDKQKWETFKVNDFNEKPYIDTLKIIDCKFWEDYKAKISLDFTPQILGNIYPVFRVDESGFTHFLEKIDSRKGIITKLLTINNEWYVYMTATENIWCISGNSYILISKDKGKNWKYYYGVIGGGSIFEIIDDKYIFDGNSLFEID